MAKSKAQKHQEKEKKISYSRLGTIISLFRKWSQSSVTSLKKKVFSDHQAVIANISKKY